jgi:Aspartyl protease
MTNFKSFAFLVLAATIVPALPAEMHCPGNIASLPFRFVHHHLIVLAVSINHTGPYNFQLDTGTQVTMVDPALATGLHLETQGAAIVAGAGPRQSALIAKLDLLEAGSRSVANPRVVVYDPQNLQSAGLHVQGILGEDFLQHFDMLIDYANSLLCLDDTGAMRAAVKGTHIPLVVSAEPANGAELPGLLIITVHLTDGTRPIRLMLDSGANAPILYNKAQYTALQLSQSLAVRGKGVDGAQRIFSVLPPQDLKIGALELTGVPFLSLEGSQKDSMAKGFDGVLTMGLFRRIFIDHAEHFAILEARQK